MAPYFIRNLLPRRQARDANRRPLGPLLRSLTLIQWAQFLTGWLAWTCDAIDFFNVALSVTRLQKQFNKPDASSITTAITLTLLVRSIGAVLFGVLSDRYGRKWPLVANLLLCSTVQLGTSFVQTFQQFLAVRSLFGIAMGGVWGLASSTALENLPVEARGLASGVLQQGYAVGYLISAIMSLYLVPNNPHTWRALFWATSAISAFAATIRALVPESEVFLRAKAQERAFGANPGKRTKVFIRQIGAMLKQHWALCIYAILLMAGFNFLSHGSQDLYPTYLKTSKGFDNYHAIVATIIGNCGAITGGAIAGSVSQYIGRRLTIISFVLLSGVFIPLWILPSGFSGLAAGAFCVQFGVQGAWGVIPIQLAEMSPPGFRATFPGVAYQLGNMISSASAQIEAIGGNHLKTTINKNGKATVVPDYATVQGILLGAIATFVIFITIIGPENHGSNFENETTAFEQRKVLDKVRLSELGGIDKVPRPIDTRSEEINDKF
ncbi:MFS general substrate transporter [Multifurca ochricompacta]|uniref:MFS general substrate transporter n=1 Tax=Multifurca ochricompacta TaxID=376703 RepID=A0AAD4M346_9AGAM|nr:MFS general substrate transporter [Multifurca ochricompacta]